MFLYLGNVPGTLQELLHCNSYEVCAFWDVKKAIRDVGQILLLTIALSESFFLFVFFLTSVSSVKTDANTQFKKLSRSDTTFSKLFLCLTGSDFKQY